MFSSLTFTSFSFFTVGDIFHCDFDIDGLCSMMNDDEGDNFDWEHDFNDDGFELPPGGHILVDAKGHVFEEKAIISTPFLSTQGVQCVSFR